MRNAPSIRQYMRPNRPYLRPSRRNPRPSQRYPAVYQAPRPPAGISKTTKIVICVVITAVVLLGVIAIALGVGLGLGLKKSSTSASCSCGCATLNVNSVTSRVIGGTTATPNSWPWIVAIYNNDSFVCGGSLISYNHVLTAADCLLNATTSSLTVYAGVHKLGDRSSTLMRNVSNAWSHPGYNAVTLDNDIAVLKLSSAFIQSNTIGLACLPLASSSVPTIGQNGMLIGWGRTSSTVNITNERMLQQAVLQVRNSTICALNNTIDRQICVGSSSAGSCSGDNGGPFNTNVNDAWTVTGVVGYSTAFCNSSSMYARVSFYRSLIDTQMQTL